MSTEPLLTSEHHLLISPALLQDVSPSSFILHRITWMSYNSWMCSTSFFTFPKSFCRLCILVRCQGFISGEVPLVVFRKMLEVLLVEAAVILDCTREKWTKMSAMDVCPR
uniref:Uncharacterized protein n=1 Tax=Cacopsylla melanoneura TaxID=428564 RepID=A0A8D8RIU8_9HEMI